MSKMKDRIILLDLNYTLVSNQEKTRMIRPFSSRLRAEDYRKDLIEAIKPNRVIIITARPSYQGRESLENIQRKTHWNPMEAYFNDLNLDPPSIKESILERLCSPSMVRTGTCTSRWRAIRERGLCITVTESLRNPMTSSSSGSQRLCCG